MAGKTGFMYVFNRVTGEPIWPIEERPVPTKTDVPGEQVWPTQPFPTSPPPFARQKFTADDINPYLLTPAEQETFKQRVAAARNEGLFTPIGFTEVIHMPGNNGGSNFGSTSANPSDGTVYVISYDIPAIMRLLTPEEAAAAEAAVAEMAAAPPARGSRYFSATARPATVPIAPAHRTGVAARRRSQAVAGGNAIGRHQRQGAYASTPASRGRRCRCRRVVLLAADASGAAAAGRGGAGAEPPALPPGPVVETGPAVVRPGRWTRCSRRGPQAYPEGVEAPAERYTMNGDGLYANIVKPPFTTLTSYDLNKGTIKWQVPLGDDPRLASMGITGTGTAGDFKFGVIPTATGLVFVAGGDDKLHAYDEATGKEIWSTSLGAASRGIPSMYELDGRQYLLMTASDPGVGPNRAPRLDLPRGYVAFALPAKK